ncbi:MAG TPA: hypothetical protein VMU95_04155 [Trebonia sp.]|nr:hypothetical protein [Trebonia sp.]
MQNFRPAGGGTSEMPEVSSTSEMPEVSGIVVAGGRPDADVGGTLALKATVPPTHVAP